MFTNHIHINPFSESNYVFVEKKPFLIRFLFYYHLLSFYDDGGNIHYILVNIDNTYKLTIYPLLFKKILEQTEHFVNR